MRLHASWWPTQERDDLYKRFQKGVREIQRKAVLLGGKAYNEH